MPNFCKECIRMGHPGLCSVKVGHPRPREPSEFLSSHTWAKYLCNVSYRCVLFTISPYNISNKESRRFSE